MRKPIELNQENWTNAEKTEFQQKGYRSRRPEEFPPVSSKVRPSDYDNDLDRGTIDFNPEWKNYAYHKVRIPKGTIVQGCNFSQTQPKTQAIIVVGDPKDVTFIDCNLVNVDINPNWVIQRCNTSQSWIVVDENGNEERQYVASHPKNLLANPIPPANAVTRRNF